MNKRVHSLDVVRSLAHSIDPVAQPYHFADHEHGRGADLHPRDSIRQFVETGGDDALPFDGFPAARN